MAHLLFIIAFAIFGLSFVALVTAAFISSSRSFCIPVRLFGVFSLGISFLLLGLAVLLVDMTNHNVTLGTLFVTGLSTYFGIDAIRKGLAEKNAVGW